jgi:hypothetical protein
MVVMVCAVAIEKAAKARLIAHVAIKRTTLIMEPPVVFQSFESEM